MDLVIFVCMLYACTLVLFVNMYCTYMSYMRADNNSTIIKNEKTNTMNISDNNSIFFGQIRRSYPHCYDLSPFAVAHKC